MSNTSAQVYPSWDAGLQFGGFPLTLSTPNMLAIGNACGAVFGPAMVAFQELAVTVAPSAVGSIKAWHKANQHPMSAHLPLMDPIDVLFGVLAYFVGLVAFYFIGRLTGKLELRLFGILHNTFLTALSAYMAIGVGWEVYVSGYSLWNNPVTITKYSTSLMNVLWVFYVSKLTEYVDTYIMMLKHNYRQVSFLHLFHHCSIFVVVYVFLVMAPGGDGYWAAMVNSGIHVVMYGYYMLNLIFTTGPVRAFLQANKFIITYGQITQFVFNFAQTVFVLFITAKPLYHPVPMWINFFYMLVLITLFSNFLIKNKAAAKRAAKEKATAKAKKTQ